MCNKIPFNCFPNINKASQLVLEMCVCCTYRDAHTEMQISHIADAPTCNPLGKKNMNSPLFRKCFLHHL